MFEGSARFAGGGIDTLVSAGDVLVLSGGDTLSAAVERATPDEFVRWCRSHDYDEKRLATPHHISHLSYRVRRPLAQIFGYVGWVGTPGSRAAASSVWPRSFLKPSPVEPHDYFDNTDITVK